MQEVRSLILKNGIHESDVTYLGDFKIWVEDNRSNDNQLFFQIKKTYYSVHILQLVVTKNHHSLVKNLTVDTLSEYGVYTPPRVRYLVW